MKQRKDWQEADLRAAAAQAGLHCGSWIVVLEYAETREHQYVARRVQLGWVLTLYPHHCYCRMENGRRESFRYTEFLGREERKVVLLSGRNREKKKAA